MVCLQIVCRHLLQGSTNCVYGPVLTRRINTVLMYCMKSETKSVLRHVVHGFRFLISASESVSKCTVSVLHEKYTVSQSTGSDLACVMSACGLRLCSGKQGADIEHILGHGVMPRDQHADTVNRVIKVGSAKVRDAWSILMPYHESMTHSTRFCV